MNKSFSCLQLFQYPLFKLGFLIFRDCSASEHCGQSVVDCILSLQNQRYSQKPAKLKAVLVRSLRCWISQRIIQPIVRMRKTTKVPVKNNSWCSADRVTIPKTMLTQLKPTTNIFDIDTIQNKVSSGLYALDNNVTNCL